MSRNAHSLVSVPKLLDVLSHSEESCASRTIIISLTAGLEETKKTKGAATVDAFDDEPYGNDEFGNSSGTTISARRSTIGSVGERTKDKRGWNNSIEFLMSCVALSVGFGNIWRFPFTAYENGGGAFLIPYIILLILVGKPFYYLEMIVGQFSGKSSIKVWNVSPGFAGVGWAQLCSTMALATYYCALMALTLFYLISSFAEELPWASCPENLADICVNSGGPQNGLNQSENFLIIEKKKYSSAELYFTRVVLKETDSIDSGIGMPDWKLTLCLLGSWTTVCLILSRGIKSTGRASYFLAIFPYIVLVSLLGVSVSLEGASNGIVFFITPVWTKLLDPKVWYAAVTQCFFSLSVCFGAIITYSSHNDFKHNIYRDVIIITSLDTFTSMMAGCTIFGVLGNLAFEMGTDDIGSVVRAGTGLAFVSYPDAIAKFTVLPQLFAVLFFLMMFVLGVGSSVGMTGSIISGILEQFPNFKYWQVMYPVCFVGFVIGLVYLTPGGQFILTLVDYYGTSFVVFVVASFEIVGLIWVYGFENFLDDVEFMLEKKPSLYWRMCWFVVTPLSLIAIFIYTVATLSPLTYGNSKFPWTAHIAGILILAIGVGQIPFWAVLALLKNRRSPSHDVWKKAFSPSCDWGPRSEEDRRDWLIFIEKRAKMRSLRAQSRWLQNLHNDRSKTRRSYPKVE